MTLTKSENYQNQKTRDRKKKKKEIQKINRKILEHRNNSYKICITKRYLQKNK